MKMSEPTHVHDATVEASVGGIVILRRRLQGNALGANVSNGDGRIFNVAIRLEPNLVRHLSVSSFFVVLFGGFDCWFMGFKIFLASSAPKVSPVPPA